MHINKAKTLTFGVLLSAGLAFAANAKEVSINGHNHDQVKKACGGEDDVYWVEGSTGKTYGCLHGDGSGIVCGGVTAQQKKTCSTFRQASFPKPELPTRDAVSKLKAAD